MVPLCALTLVAGFAVQTTAYGPDPKQQVDVYLPSPTPEAGAPRPLAVFFHGGVWQLGDRRDARSIGAALAARGYVTLVASYRLAPAHPWPAQRDDAAAVVALAQRRAPSWGADPQRVVVIGHSAGGQLAALLAIDGAPLSAAGGDPRGVRAVVALSGVFDLRAPLDEHQDDGGFARFIAPVFGRDVAVLRAASPIDHAPRLTLPILLVTSTNDYAAMREQSAAMARALSLARKAPAPHPVVAIDGRDHFGLVSEFGAPRDEVVRRVVTFLDGVVGRTPTAGH